MGIQESMFVLDDIIGWTKKRKEKKLKSKSLSYHITECPSNVVIICEDYNEAEKIIELFFQKMSSEQEISFYGYYKLYIFLKNYKSSVIYTTSKKTYMSDLKGISIDFLMFTSSIKRDIKSNIIKNLYQQIEIDKTTIGKLKIEDMKG